MPPKRASTRKRQAKLTFSPLPPSASAASGLSPQVRNRAAAVAIEGSPSRPSRKRKLLELSSDSDVVLPTPKKSFSLKPFTAHDEEVDRSMQSGMPVRVQRNGMFGSSDIDDAGSGTSSSSESEPAPAVVTKQSRKKKSKTSVPKSESSGEDELAMVTAPVKKKARQRKSKKPAPKTGSSDDDDDAPATVTRQGRQKKSKPPAPESESSDDDDIPVSTARIRRTRNGGQEASKRKEVAMEDSEDEICPPSTRRRRATRPPAVSESESEAASEERGKDQEEEDSDGDTEASEERQASGADADDDDDERKELKEDLEFLQSSPPPSRDRLRSLNSKPLSERQKALEALKKRRAKNTSSDAPPSSASTPGRKRKVVDSDTDSSLEVIEEEDEQEDPDEEEEEIEEAPRRMRASDLFREKDDDADFINDDPDAVIGEPAELESIPLEFSSLSRAKPRELFKYAVEWMVQKKINPAFSSTDEIYTLAFRKLDDEVNGLANSKYSSAAWTSDFTRALRARPEIFINEIGKMERSVMDHHCEACNRRSHPGTFTITFSGKPYNKETLEPLAEEDSDSSSDSELSSASESSDRHGDKKTYDAQGELIPPESKVFNVGSTCKANAQMAHTLRHWRYHLNSWVVDYLVRMGHCTPEKLVKRDKWSQRKREKAANKIVDAMETSGEIRKLHKLYKDQVDFAVEAKNEYTRGWGRR